MIFRVQSPLISLPAEGSARRDPNELQRSGGRMVDLRKKGSAPGLELLEQAQQGLFEHGKKLLDQVQLDLNIDAQLCNGRRRRTKSVGLNLSPSRQRISPVRSPTSSTSPSSPAAPWLPPSSPPSWTQAGVAWLKMSHVDDLQAAAVSVCTRAGSVTPHSNPQDLAVGGCELSLRLHAPRHRGDRSLPQSQKAPWYTPELEPLPLISSRNYRADALQKVGSAQLSRALGMGHRAYGYNPSFFAAGLLHMEEHQSQRTSAGLRSQAVTQAAGRLCTRAWWRAGSLDRVHRASHRAEYLRPSLPAAQRPRRAGWLHRAAGARSTRT